MDKNVLIQYCDMKEEIKDLRRRITETEKQIFRIAEEGTYKKHIIGMNQDSMYVIEDLGGAKVNKYKYEVNYIPESIVPFTVKSSK